MKSKEYLINRRYKKVKAGEEYLSNYCKRRVTIVSIIITIFIYIFINLIFNCFKQTLNQKEIKSKTLIFKISKINPINQNNIYKTN